MTLDRTPAIIAHRVIHDRRCVIVTLGPRAHFRHMVIDFRTLIDREPVTLDYDYICDLTNFDGDAFQSDVQQIADAHRTRAGGAATFTCFATPDRNFELWARAMDEVFLTGKHLVFRTVSDCSAFLEQNPANGRALS